MASILLDGVTVVKDDVVVLDDLTLRVEDGECVVLLGPSGSGKTTILRTVAGLDEPVRGDVLIDGEVATGLPPAQRDVAMVFQDNALFPFLSARRNVAFPLRVRHLPDREIEARVEAEAAVLAIESVLDRMPGTLSAGHQQLVQAARALVRRPAVFLMDEPLARLDAHARVTMRREFMLLQQGYGVTTLYATNDHAEAMVIAERVVVLDEGRIRQTGSPAEVYHRPVDDFVAGFIGSPPMAFFDAAIQSGVLRMAEWSVPVAAPSGPVLVGVRAEGWRLGEGLKGVTEGVEWLGDHGFALTRIAGVRAPIRVEERPAIGDHVYATPCAYHVFSRTTGRALVHVG